METFPSNAALLIIDVQKGFDEPGWGRRNNPELEARVAELLAAFRAKNRPVIHARHMSTLATSPLRPGQPGNEFKPQAAPLPGERVIEKRVNSCFIGTPLEAELRRNGYDTLVLAGLTTNHCVSTTARMAGNLGFNAFVVSDATATFNRVGPDGIDYPAEQIHAIALSDLHGEFATVIDTRQVLAKLGALALTLALTLTACANGQANKAAEAIPLKGIETSELNRTIDPCSDFHEFANGTWRAQNPIPEGQPRWSHRAEGREQNKKRLQELLEELAKKKDWPAGSAEQVAGDHYASCMDEAAIEAAGPTPLAPLLAELDAIHDLGGLQRGIRKLHDAGVNVPFALNADLDNHEPLKFIENVIAGTLGLPDKEQYSKSEARFAEIREKYRAHLARLLVLRGMPAAEAARSAEAAIALEKRLADASLDSAAANDPAATDHPMTFAQLTLAYPRIGFETYFADAGISRADLNVAEPKLLEEINQALKDAPIETWKAYLIAQLLDSASPFLSKPFAEESADFHEKVLGGPALPRLRARRCLEATDALFGEALGRIYVERYFPAQAKAKMQEIAQSLLAVIKDDIPNVPWMLPETRKRALDKLATYNAQLGYPNQWKSLSGLVARRDAFWANTALGRKYLADDNRRMAGRPTDLNLWRLPPSSPDAYLDLQINEIVLPAGFLRAPAFSVEASDAVNYGAIGAGLAHDMTHSIDESGSTLDPQGRPVPWWTAKDKEEFQKRAACLIDQYDGYFIEPATHLDGRKISSETIADLAGVHFAYLALKRSMQQHPLPVIDGFSPEQQFFISWGQFRGEAQRLETQRQLIKTDTHPVGKFRVNGPLVNLPEFQEAFSCKAGAEMVRPPEKRCAVW